MKNNICVSVIIPVYNSEEYLTQCLDSILNQSLKEIEVICINDCSTDNSLEIMKEFSLRDERFEFYQVSKNAGSGNARNVGLNYAKGDYISFIDSDDFIIDKTSYEKLYNFAMEYNADIVSSNMKEYTTDNKLQNSVHCAPITEITRKLSEDYGIPWYFWKNLFKREFLNDHGIIFPEYRRGQDPVFLAKSIKNTEFVYYLPIDFYAYRYRYEDNPYKITSEESERDYMQHFKDVFEILEDDKYRKIRFEYEEYMFKFLVDQKYFFSSKTVEKNFKNIFENKPEFIKIFELEYALLEKNKHIGELKSSLSNEKIIKEKMQSSKSWKVTKPLRKCGSIVRKMKI